MHSVGLKFGLYANYGENSCGGFAGSKNHLKMDAQTLASWGVDYVKLTACDYDSQEDDLDEAYMEFNRYLRATGRRIVYSCTWPVYQILDGVPPNWQAVTETCDTFRMFSNTDDSFLSIETVKASYIENQDLIGSISGPGHYADMDAVCINFNLKKTP